jgi:hypothetical protein
MVALHVHLHLEVVVLILEHDHVANFHIDLKGELLPSLEENESDSLSKHLHHVLAPFTHHDLHLHCLLLVLVNMLDPNSPTPTSAPMPFPTPKRT